MPDILLWFVVLIAFSALIYLQFKYARAGCPNDWRWRAILFAIGGSVVDLSGYMVVTRIDKGLYPPMAHLFMIAFGGLLFAWPAWWMRNMVPSKNYDK